MEWKEMEETRGGKEKEGEKRRRNAEEWNENPADANFGIAVAKL